VKFIVEPDFLVQGCAIGDTGIGTKGKPRWIDGLALFSGLLPITGGTCRRTHIGDPLNKLRYYT
jgi:hypothetical protein